VEGGVEGGQITVKQRVETADPRCPDFLALQLGDQLCRFVALEPAERPAARINVHIHSHGLTPLRRKMGVSNWRRFSLRICFFAVSGTLAPCTLASCEAKLRPGTSLP